MKSLRREYPLSTLLELIGMPRSTYYYHEANPPSDRQATERPAIVEICEKSQFRYGYRRVADTLRKATGVRIADKTVLKVMREEGLLCRTRRRRKRRSYMGQVGKSSPNLLARDFEAEGPMTKLVTDVTEFKVGSTKLYLLPVVDLCNDEVIAYSTSGSPNMKMALEMLAGLEGRLDGEDAPLLHSDMGWQYQMPAYRFALERRGSPCPAKETASTTRRPKTSSRWSRPSFTTIGRETTPISSRGIWRSTSTGTTTCASRDAWTEAARSSTGSAGLLDSLLLPFRKRGPLQIRGAVQIRRAFASRTGKTVPVPKFPLTP